MSQRPQAAPLKATVTENGIVLPLMEADPPVVLQMPRTAQATRLTIEPGDGTRRALVMMDQSGQAQRLAQFADAGAAGRALQTLAEAMGKPTPVPGGVIGRLTGGTSGQAAWIGALAGLAASLLVTTIGGFVMAANQSNQLAKLTTDAKAVAFDFGGAVAQAQAEAITGTMMRLLTQGQLPTGPAGGNQVLGPNERPMVRPSTEAGQQIPPVEAAIPLPAEQQPMGTAVSADDFFKGMEPGGEDPGVGK